MVLVAEDRGRASSSRGKLWWLVAARWPPVNPGETPQDPQGEGRKGQFWPGESSDLPLSSAGPRGAHHRGERVSFASGQHPKHWPPWVLCLSEAKTRDAGAKGQRALEADEFIWQCMQWRGFRWQIYSRRSDRRRQMAAGQVVRSPRRITAFVAGFRHGGGRRKRTACRDRRERTRDPQETVEPGQDDGECLVG